MNRKAFQVAVSSLAMAAALAIAPLTSYATTGWATSRCQRLKAGHPSGGKAGES